MKLLLFHLCSSLPTSTLFSLTLLIFISSGHAYPHHPIAFLPTLENPDWEAALLQLQTSLGVPGAAPMPGIRPWGLRQPLGPEDQHLGPARELEAEADWGQGGIHRGPREELGRRPMGPFPDRSMESVHYQEGGENEGEGGEKQNEALTSIAGGLQAFNRQKGGFGFRFGRK